MSNNIINKEKLDDHTVQRYRFKVLGSNLAEAQESAPTDETYRGDSGSIVETKPAFDEGSLPTARIEEGQNQFVEELLKKTDELTSNVIKLQIQIERQEQDFNNRLSDELKRERENAYNSGYQKAKEESELLLQETKSRYLRSITALDTFSKNMEEILAKLESDMHLTAFEIAKEVIKKEIQESSSKVAVALSKELLKELKDATKIELRANPKDVEELKESYINDEKIKIIADDAITLGGVIILSDIGNLDGNIAMRLEKVKYLIQE